MILPKVGFRKFKEKGKNISNYFSKKEIQLISQLCKLSREVIQCDDGKHN